MCVVDRVHRTIRDRIYKYFAYRNNYRYIGVLPEFVKAYNDSTLDHMHGAFSCD